jgi:prepilin-type N-terminal cleavage/methylation domain-containing protein
MMTKIAHMRENRKANKGFSLVELIIVMAIMVALVAVLAPQYIRYLQRSRDAVVTNAAEDVMTAVKTDFIDPQGDLVLDGADQATAASPKTGTVTVAAGANGAPITITTEHIKQNSDSTKNGVDYLMKLAGVDSTRKVKSSVTKVITVKFDGTNYDFTIA